jgi:iron complex outermembrane receptor protein
MQSACEDADAFMRPAPDLIQTMKRFFLLIAGITLAATASAQEPQQLSSVEVKGRKKTVKERAEFQHHAQTTEVLTEEELNRNNPAFIEQSLNTVAGVQVDKRTQAGGQRIVIRGYGNDQKFNNWGIKAYYNGIPLTTADGVTVLDDVDFSLINNIEIIKGPAATEYGAGVGGVARFYLRTSEVKGVSLSERFIAGSYDLIQSNTRLDVVGDHSSIAVNFSHLQSNGYRPHGASLKNFFTTFGDFRLSGKHRMSYYLSHNFSHDEVCGQISYPDYYAGIDKGNQAYIKKNARNNMQTTRIGLSNYYQLTKGLSNATTLFYSNADYKRVSAGADENSMNPNFGIRSVFNWKTQLGNKFSNGLELGMELQESRSLVSGYRFTGTNDSIPQQVNPINTASYFRYTSNQYSYFAIDRLTYRPWKLTLVAGISANTIRYRRVDLLAAPGLIGNYNKDLSFEKNFETSFNPHVALQKLWKAQIFQLSYSQGYNAPTSATSFITAIGKANDSLLPEKGRMLEFSVQGLLLNTHLDYQFSIFRLDVDDKLTQLSGVNPAGGTYSYTANTGQQRNQGIELSIGYIWRPAKNPLIARVEPFLSGSLYDFSYMDFKTIVGGKLNDYSTKQVVGVPRQKYTVGLDLGSPQGFYANTTFFYSGDVYTDFANMNKVGSFTQLNAKLGYRHSFALARFMPKRFDLDVFVAGNNLSNQFNYTFLFLGNNINDADPGSGYPAGMATDVNPGPSLAYFFGGIGLKYRF